MAASFSPPRPALGHKRLNTAEHTATWRAPTIKACQRRRAAACRNRAQQRPEEGDGEQPSTSKSYRKTYNNNVNFPDSPASSTEQWSAHLRNVYTFQPMFKSNVREELRNSYTTAMQGSTLRSRLRFFFDQLRYQYFLWRKDTFNDLQVFTLLNVVFVVGSGLLKYKVAPLVEGADLWGNVYKVGVLMFGNSFPDLDAGTTDQLFSLGVAAIGIGGFGITLALVEQVVLEVLEENVKQGSQVYEQGHLVVLLWGKSSRDLEMAQQVLQQACAAYAGRGGKALVVLSQREKFEMEEYYRRAIPERKRAGSRFVFRQGSALDAATLVKLNVPEAEAIIIISDNSRSPEEADAQVLRTAVVLDELGYPGPGLPDPRRAIVVAELKTLDAVGLLQFCCSPRCVGVPSNLSSARSLCRMVRTPIMSAVSQLLWDFEGHCQAYVQHFPQLVGRTARELPFYFTDGLVLGVLQGGYKRMVMNPPPELVIGAQDDIFLARPSVARHAGAYEPLAQPVVVDAGEWQAEAPGEVSAVADELAWEVLNMADEVLDAIDATMSVDARSLTSCVLPSEYLDSMDAPAGVLVCGWGERSMMCSLLREMDRGVSALPANSDIILYNEHSEEEVQEVLSSVGIRSLSISHVRGNVFDGEALAARVDLRSLRCAIVLCDINWQDPDQIETNGIEMHNEADMMRLDSMVLAIQLNIRRMLRMAGLPSINIITEKLSTAGQLTRFEDQVRVPMGVTLNFASMGARLLMQVAYNPQVLFPLFSFGRENMLVVRDASMLSRLHEPLSFWQLMARAQLAGCTLVGYYAIPADGEEGRTLEVVLNPLSNEKRSVRRVWHDGKGRTKLLMVAAKAAGRRPEQRLSAAAAPGGAHDAASNGTSAGIDVGTFEEMSDGDDDVMQSGMTQQLQRFGEYSMQRAADGKVGASAGTPARM